MEFLNVIYKDSFRTDKARSKRKLFAERFHKDWTVIKGFIERGIGFSLSDETNQRGNSFFFPVSYMQLLIISY